MGSSGFGTHTPGHAHPRTRSRRGQKTMARRRVVDSLHLVTNLAFFSFVSSSTTAHSRIPHVPLPLPLPLASSTCTCSCVQPSHARGNRLHDVLPAPRPRRRNASLLPFLVNTSTPISTEPPTPDSDRLQHGKLVGRGGGASTSGPAPRRPRHSPHPPSRRILCGRCSL